MPPPQSALGDPSSPTAGDPPADHLLAMYRTMRAIRAFEEKSLELYAARKLPGNLHNSIGQEAIAVGAVAALRPDDYIVSTHRCHAHLIAKGVDKGRMMAEICGKAAGTNRGKGGELHLQDFSAGVLGSISVVGGGLPLAVGGALGERVKGTDRVVLAFFGDGAANQGTFHESLNLAGVLRLPVVFVCENNLYAQSTHVRRTSAVPRVADRAAAYAMPGVTLDGNDLVAVYATVRKAAERARGGGGPSLVECETYRWVGHWTADPEAYRTREEVEAWRAKCPIVRCGRLLRAQGSLDDAAEARIVAEAQAAAAEAAAFALEAPYPDTGEALTDVFSGEVPA